MHGSNVADVTQVHKLLHGQEETVYGDSGYICADKREELQSMKAGFLIAEKPFRLRTITKKRERHYAKRWEHHKASIRAKVKHPFRAVKCQFPYTSILKLPRYRSNRVENPQPPHEDLIGNDGPHPMPHSRFDFSSCTIWRTSSSNCLLSYTMPSLTM